MIVTFKKSYTATSKTTFEDCGITTRSHLTSLLPNPKSGFIVNIARSPFFIVAIARSRPAITCSKDSEAKSIQSCFLTI
jgi:hypothetical protein